MKPSTTKRLWELTAGYRKQYLAAIAAMGVGTVFLLLVPSVLKWALDAMSTGSATLRGTLVPAAIAIVGCNSINGYFTYLRGKWAAEASEGIIRGLRHRLFVHLQHLPCSYHDRADTGDLVQRCSSDVETVRVFLAAQIVEVGRISLFLLIAIPMMVVQSLLMTFVSLCIVPIIIIFALLFFRRVRKLFEQVDAAEGQLTTVIQENLTGVRVVRAFSQQTFEIDKFLGHNGKFRDLEMQLFRALSNYWAISDLLCFAQLGVILIGGGYLVAQDNLSLGTWILFFWLLRTIIWPIRHLGRVLADSGKAIVAIGRIEEILAEPTEQILAGETKLDEHTNSEHTKSEHPGGNHKSTAPLPFGDIEFHNLSFAYNPGDKLAVNDLSLTIAAGETVAILGPPGSGKSTLIRLLVRMYEFEQGQIKIGGKSIKELPRHQLRSAFGIVLQDPFLYSKTVGQNIAVGAADATPEAVTQAAKDAVVHENIRRFESAYDTKIGERGVTLSGGQRQRLAIARALIKEPQFLVLDDSLSAVDTQTEAAILRALSKHTQQRTTILITHRISSTRLANRIIVLEQGRIAQAGTHEELVAEPGYYRRLWQIQSDLAEELSQDLSAAASRSEDLLRDQACGKEAQRHE